MSESYVSDAVVPVQVAPAQAPAPAPASPLRWTCPACGDIRRSVRFEVVTTDTENGVSADAFRPSADVFGSTLGRVVRCLSCGHGSLAACPSPEAIASAYVDAADPVSVREERGQVETAARALAWIESFVSPGRLLDIGCWTGSFLVAAQQRGWHVTGVEPSQWGAGRANARGVPVQHCALELAELADEYDAIVLCDVLEHLIDPAAALRLLRQRLRPGGVLYVTVPDAGSLLARAMGRRWWSVLPMHLQYFTRASMRRLLSDTGYQVAAARTHPKVFTARYYVERLSGYSPGMQRVVERALGASGQAERLIAPDFRDRMQIVALA